MAETVVETERLILRRWRDSDLGEWLQHLNTPEVRAHLGGIDTPEKVAEKFARLKARWDEKGFSFLAVERRENGKFLGACGLGQIETECAPDELRGSVEIGWQFRADSWGQGYASEAAQAMLRLGFERFGLPVIYSQTSENNRGSWGLMERLGMERLAHLDYEDPAYPAAENPTKVYGLQRAAWQAVNA
ncbi:GNAT family N-acetyltransferase [Altererythrobacter salegens]|uniref:GNAT family N-acetyltransferase n=1 Tax=Croceibacterium salegens TaxID=1737568 RepID=A0A6I4T1K0_9SPHN|nr:GNAT family N-acetyltransferase [Croceibacterium salegens]MXO60522.1 GNAT family N-acetyltransferase [Croceibacterium salegens]